MALFRRLAAAAIIAGALAGAALAAPQSDITKDPHAVQAGSYALEPSHTRVMFGVSHMGFSTYYGEFTGASGQLTLDPKNPAASSVDVSVPVGNVTTPSEKLTGELKAADWLDAEKYPTIAFKSRKVTPAGAHQAKIEGDLTLHGVTQPVTLTATFNAAGTNPIDKAYTTGFEVSGKISRSAFGVKTYVPLIGDEVDLIISAAFEKKAS